MSLRFLGSIVIPFLSRLDDFPLFLGRVTTLREGLKLLMYFGIACIFITVNEGKWEPRNYVGASLV